MRIRRFSLDRGAASTPGSSSTLSVPSAMSSLHHRAKDVFLAALAIPLPAVPHCDGSGGVTSACERVDRAGFHDEDAAEGAAGARYPGRLRQSRCCRPLSDDQRIGRGGMVMSGRPIPLARDGRCIEVDQFDRSRRAGAHPQRSSSGEADHPPRCVASSTSASGRGSSTRWMWLRKISPRYSARRRLPSEKVVDIARQLCAGGRGARARRPASRSETANVLIDNEGLVRSPISGLRFQNRAGLHSVRGPALYGPEQRAQGTRSRNKPTSTRWAGAVQLRSDQSFKRSIKRGRCRSHRRCRRRHPELERVVMQALSPDPRESSARLSKWQ